MPEVQTPPPTLEAAAAALRAARRRLQQASSAVESFLAKSEQVFLDTGSLLTGLEGRARTVLARSKAALTLGGDAAGADPAELLDGELASLERYLAATQEASAAEVARLREISARAGLLASTWRDVEDVARTMRVVGVNTRVENARASAPSAGMETVAAEVRRLADSIERELLAVFRQVAGVGQNAARARVAAERFLERQRVCGGTMLGETRAALDGLQDLARREAAVASAAVSASEGVAAGVSDVLMALQVHDATRQVLEHVVEEAASLEADARRAAAEAAFDARAWLSEVGETARVLRAQVAGARERLSAGLEGIGTGLDSIADRVSGLGAEAARLVGRGEGSRVEPVQRAIAAATDTLREHVAQEERTAAGMRSVAATVEGLSVKVRDVKGIAHAVKLIALNALVETERAGGGGRALGVLAQQMGSLALEVTRHGDQVSRALCDIAGAAGALALPQDGADSEGVRIAANLSSLLVRLCTYHEQLREFLAALDGESRALHRAVGDIARPLAAQAAAAAALARVERELGEVARQAERLVGPAPRGRRVRQSSLSSRYTMDMEREAHRAATRAPLAAPGPAAAPQPAGGAGSGGGVAGAAPSLGDNVELF